MLPICKYYITSHDSILYKKMWFFTKKEGFFTPFSSFFVIFAGFEHKNAPFRGADGDVIAKLSTRRQIA